jgi:hypothetical protein
VGSGSEGSPGRKLTEFPEEFMTKNSGADGINAAMPPLIGNHGKFFWQKSAIRAGDFSQKEI